MGECTENVEDSISAATYLFISFFKEQHALLIENYNYPTMLLSQTPKTVPPL